MGYDDEAKQMMVRLEEKLPTGLGDMLIEQIVPLGPEMLQLLIRFPESLVYAGVRRWVRKVARRFPREQALPIMIEALSHPDWRVFEIARDVVTWYGLDARDALIANLNDCPSPAGRLNTVYCLHRLADPLAPPGIGDASIVPHLARAAESDESPEVRAAAVIALSRCGAEGVDKPILAALTDESDTVRCEAAAAAGRLKLAGAVAAVASMLGHADPQVRADLLYALSRIGDPSATDPVAACLADTDWYVRWTAVKALQRLQPEHDAIGKCREDAHPLVAAAAEARQG